MSETLVKLDGQRERKRGGERADAKSDSSPTMPPKIGGFGLSFRLLSSADNARHSTAIFGGESVVAKNNGSTILSGGKWSLSEDERGPEKQELVKGVSGRTKETKEGMIIRSANEPVTTEGGNSVDFGRAEKAKNQCTKENVGTLS